jgi:hypothetical protein
VPYRNLSISVVGQACPVEISGTIDGVPYRFIARWDEWEFAAGESLLDIIFNRGAGGGFYRRGHYDPDGTGAGASYMDYAIAEDLVRRNAEEFARYLEQPASSNP